MNKDKNILENLREAREEFFIEIYRKYRDSFNSWTAKYYSCDQHTSSDCFQDAVIILMNNVKSGKLIQLNSGLKTYLFSVGKNVLLKKYSLKRKEVVFEEITMGYDSQDLLEYDELFDYKNKLIDKVAELVVNMKEPCKSILKHYYYESLSMEKIAEVMNYKNANTVKSQKLRCIKYLENLLEKKYSNINQDR